MCGSYTLNGRTALFGPGADCLAASDKAAFAGNRNRRSSIAAPNSIAWLNGEALAIISCLAQLSASGFSPISARRL
jgi:hypothetical protein